MAKLSAISFIPMEDKIQDFSDRNAVISGLTNNSFLDINWHGDRITLTGSGMLKYSNNEYIMHEVALYQFLKKLGIPAKFAARLPNDLLIEIVNRFLRDRFYATMLKPRLSPFDNSIIGFSSSASSSSPVLYLYEQLFADNKLKFMFAKSNGSSLISFFKIGDTKEDGQPLKAVEILTSNNFSCHPTVTGTVLSGNGIAIFSRLSFKASSGDVSTDVENQIPAFIMNISSEIDSCLEKYNKALKTNITEVIAKDIRSKSRKVLTEPIELDSGSKFTEFFDALRVVRNNKNTSLIKKREIALFCGSIIEMVD